MGKNHQNFFFHFWYQNDSNREKRAKFFFDFFDPKNSITPAGVTPNGQKSPKFFFSFLASEWLNSRKKAKKKNLTQNLVLECLECGPKRGQIDLPTRRFIHRLNCLTMSYLNMNFQPKALRRSRENADKPRFWA